MTGFLIAIGVLLLIVFSVAMDYRNVCKEKKVQSEANEWWLKEQLSLPRYVVEVTTKDGYTYRSKAFDPTYEVVRYYDWELYTHTSYQNATRLIEQSIKLGRYLQAGVFIPICEISTLEAVKEEKNEKV